MAAQSLSLMATRYYRVSLAVIGMAALAVAGYVFMTSGAISVPVAHVEENVAIRVFGLGTVEARVLSKVGFEVGATLVELTADHGDRVKKATFSRG